MKVCRRETFNAAHRLFIEDWNEAKNLEVFGKCSYPNYHGHNYTLEVWVDGDIDPNTGFVVDLKTLKHIIREEVIERFDHKNLNLDCPEFDGLNPTAENIAVVIWKLLRNRIDESFKLEVQLTETENNKVFYSGEE